MNPSDKAAVLKEALPYMKRWSGALVVVKVSGEVTDDPALLESLVTDFALMKHVGIDLVVVHGGGKQISQAMRNFGLEPIFDRGLRVTDSETIEVVRMVMMGQINPSIVRAMNSHAVAAVGISGDDAKFLRAAPGSNELGFVGEIDAVDSSVVRTLIRQGFVPVIAPLAPGPGGTYNINADLAAGAIAGALEATKVVFLTNVAGIFRDYGDPSTLIKQTSAEELEALLESGSLSEGMIPKVNGLLVAVRAGVPNAHILDGRIPSALLLEIFTDEGIGTMVRNNA